MPSANPMFGASAALNAPMSGYAQTPSVSSTGDKAIGAEVAVTDGTPMRVASGVLLAVLGLVGLRWSGFKFNVTSG